MNEFPITIASDIQLYYNKDNHEIIIDSKNKKPLTVNYIGNIQLKIDGDIELVSKGEMDIITHENMICLESLGSSIHFNSFMAKSVREDTRTDEEKQYSERPKTVIHVLNDRIQELENRLLTLERLFTEDELCQE